MPGTKRKRGILFKRSRKRRRLGTVQKIVNRVLNKNLETKHAVFTSSDGIEIGHNNFTSLESNLLSTTQGTSDPDTSAANNRIGDKINLRGVGIKMMLELNERYSDVTFRIMVVRSSRGDVPTRANLFVGQSGNKMLDKFNSERYTMLYQKYVKIRAPNSGTVGPSGAGGPGSGIYYQNTSNEQVLSRATRIVKFFIPGKKFARSQVIVYDNGGSSPKFFDYHFLVYAYSNYSTSQDVYYVGRINDYIKTLYYKDG